MNRSLVLVTAGLLAASGLIAPRVRAQYALRASAVASGTTDAAGGTYTLRATTGEPAIGSGSGGPYAVGQGFWYVAASEPPPAGPLVDVTLTPTDPPPPVVIARGATLRYRADFAIASDGPSSFQYWAEATLPNNQVRFLFGPVTVNGTPGTTVTLNLQQRVPRNVPLGAYVFRMKVGEYPGTVYDEDSFPGTVVASEALAVARSAPATRRREEAAARTDAGRLGAARADAARTATALAEVARRIAAAPDEWLAWDEDGTLLKAGLVQDLRLAVGPDARDEAAGAEAGTDAKASADPDATAVLSSAGLPVETALFAPAPNPAAGRVALRFDLAEGGPVRLAVYDALGREVAVLLDGAQAAGMQEAAFDVSALAPGVYVIRLQAEDFVAARRFVVAR